MRAGLDRGADLVKVGLHGGGVAPGHDEACAFSVGRADCSQDIGPLRALVVRRAGPCPTPGPATGDLVLLPDARLILEPDFYFDVRSNLVADRCQVGGQVFLNASMASASCA
jgi:hypothetical protein